MARVVVTGGTGMVGAAVTRACLDAGHEVCILVPAGLKRLAPLPDNKRLTFVDADVRELKSLHVSSIGKADLFFHLAWLGTAPGTRDAYMKQVKNIEYSLDAVDLASRLGCSSFVGAGSQAEYGRVEGELGPTTPAFPESGYGIAKLAAGQMTRLACTDVGIKHCWARILSVYGPGDNAHTMVMSVIANACAGKRPNCTAGEQMWDYLYCDDCGRALLAVAENGHHGMVYPVGSGRQQPLADYIRQICTACDTDVEPILGALPYPEGQVMNLVADTSPITKHTGWKPSISFEDGIIRTIDWYRG